MAFWGFFGGLALFLFGLGLLSRGLSALAGGRLRAGLARAAGRPARGFLLGLAATAAVQSSSAVVVMTVGLVKSGLLGLYQAAGVIFGANVGTTATAWLLLVGHSAPMPGLSASLAAALGALCFLWPGPHARRQGGLALLGLGLLMSGMNAVSAALAPLGHQPWFAGMMASPHPLVGLAAGAALTAVIQSSSAGIGILQALADTGALTWGGAVPIILGQNIGTCVTALAAGLAAGREGLRVALVHLGFNLIGTAVWGAVWLGAVRLWPGLAALPIGAGGIAAAHSLFNLATAGLLLPFAGALARLASACVRG